VRSQRHRLHLRLRRQCGAGRDGRAGGRGAAGPARRDRQPTLRRWCKLRYGAKSWKTERRVVARIEETPLGLDIRYIVTSLAGTAKHLYENVYCARGQAENFIKLHKAQLASDRTSCRDPRANQFRLILHTAAYWLLHTLRAAAPKRSAWAGAEFTTLRLRLIKLAARVIEGAARIRVRLPTSCPDAAMFMLLAGRFAAAGP
jgi:Transposase DDE domain group 1